MTDLETLADEIASEILEDQVEPEDLSPLILGHITKWIEERDTLYRRRDSLLAMARTADESAFHSRSSHGRREAQARRDRLKDQANGIEETLGIRPRTRSLS